MKVRQHDVEIEEPDLLILRVRGEISATDAEEFGKLFPTRVRGGRLFILSIIDDRVDVVMGPEGRKKFIEAMRSVPVFVNAVIGSSFRTRVIGRLTETAARALVGLDLRLRFHDDEPSARAWLREQGCVACGAPSAPDRSSGSS